MDFNVDFEDLPEEGADVWDYDSGDPDFEPSAAAAATTEHKKPMLFVLHPHNSEFRGVYWNVVKSGTTTVDEVNAAFKKWKDCERKKVPMKWDDVKPKLDLMVVAKQTKSAGKQKVGAPAKVALAAMDPDAGHCVVYDDHEHGKFLVCSILGRMHRTPTAGAISLKADVDNYNDDERIIENELGAAYPEKYAAKLKRDGQKAKKGVSAKQDPPKISGEKATTVKVKPAAKVGKSTPKKQASASQPSEAPAVKPKSKPKPKAKPNKTKLIAEAGVAPKEVEKEDEKAKAPEKEATAARIAPKRLFSDVEKVKEAEPTSPVEAIIKTVVQASETGNDGPEVKKIKLLSTAVTLCARALGMAMEAHTL